MPQMYICIDSVAECTAIYPIYLIKKFTAIIKCFYSYCDLILGKNIQAMYAILVNL